MSFYTANILGYLGLKLLPLTDSYVRYNRVTTGSTRTFSTSRAWIVYKVSICSLSRDTYFKVVFYTHTRTDSLLLIDNVGIDGLGVAFSSMQTQKNAENWFEFNPSNFWKDFIADPRGRDRKQPKDVSSSVNKQHLRTVYKGTMVYNVITFDAKCEGNSSHAQQAFRISWAYGLILLGDDLTGELWMKPCQNCMYHSMGSTFDQV